MFLGFCEWQGDLFCNDVEVEMELVMWEWCNK